jgi:Na+-driven multidrug efflux pump
MKAGIIAVMVNLVFNYLLIYGHFGFPELGVVGAAIATVISRFVEIAIIILWTKIHREKCEYLQGVYRTLKVPGALAWKFFVTGVPLLLNETLWSAGMAMLGQCYSLRGLNVVAGQNIANTINNVFNVIFIAMGDAIAIIVGQLLGAGKMKEARDTDNKIIAFSVFCGVLTAVLSAAAAPFFPLIYNTTDQAKTVATTFILITALFTPQMAFMHAVYFTIRSGGKTIITFIFDSAFVWVITVPLAFILSRYTNMSVYWILTIVYMADWIKCIIGFILVRNDSWMNNIVSDSR